MSFIKRRSAYNFPEKLSSASHKTNDLSSKRFQEIKHNLGLAKNVLKQSSLEKGFSDSLKKIIDDKNKIDNKSGIWIWNLADIPKTPAKLDEFLKVVNQKGLTRLYVNGHPNITLNQNTAEFKNLIEKSGNYNIKIDILLGNPEWVSDLNQAKVFKEEFLPSVINFWKECPDNLKPGLHLDIEPHCLPQWQSDQENLLTKTMSLYDDVNDVLKKSKVDIELSADIPHWWDNIKQKNGKTAFENISDKVSNVLIMSYGDTSHKVKALSREELLSSNHHKVITAIETDGAVLIGWDNNNNQIKGEDLKQAANNIFQTTKKLSIHPRPNTDLLQILSSLSDKPN